MMQAGVPVVPGSKEPVYTAEDDFVSGKEIGFPVMIKASPAAAERECVFPEAKRTLQSILMQLS